LSPDSVSTNPLLHLLGLARRARTAGGIEELAFMAVNDSRALVSYRQAALWFADGGIKALSGVVEIEANAPYVQWLERVCPTLPADAGRSIRVSAASLPPRESAEWPQWLPEFGMWLPLPPPEGNDEHGPGGLLLAAEQPWPEASLALMDEWMDAWFHAWRTQTKPREWSKAGLQRMWKRWTSAQAELPWWKQRRVRATLALACIALFPVRLTVLAPGELVPANPIAIRAPVDGVIGQFHVRPNESVKAGQALYGFDEAAIVARLEVAEQALATAQTEYRQFAQQAVSDLRSKSQLAILLGKIEEKRAEADYLRGQLERARVVAPLDGIALFDDPSEWIGRPVQTGERIMRIAAPGDIEVEAWLPLGDAIPIEDDAEVDLYLAARPFSSLSARVRYAAYEAVPRPDGVYAYRLRARLDTPTDQRVGLKGTARINGERVPMIYWMLRRPLATIRQTVGF
jgi:hypothetical protein